MKANSKQSDQIHPFSVARIIPFIIIIVFAFYCFFNTFASDTFQALSSRDQPSVKPTVIFMVSDGFGPASQTFARTFYQQAIYGNGDVPPRYEGLPVLPLDTIFVGQSRTRSSSSWITDSAAGATAFSCANKTYNGAVAVNDEFLPCGTILEAAKLTGYVIF
jgi:alkaline phosphatase